MRNFFISKRRILACVLAVVLLIAAIPQVAAHGWIVKAEGGNDVTGSAGVASVTASTDYVGSRDVTSFDMVMNFTLADCDGSEDDPEGHPFGRRGVEPGDYIRYTFPSTVKVADVTSAPVTTPAGDTIANYSIANNELTITFVEGLNDFNSVAGGASLNLTLDPSVLENEAEQDIVVTPDGFPNPVTVHIPAVPKVIDGVTLNNSGMNSGNKITWTEVVGTAPESNGASLAGVTITNTIDPSYQTWESAVIPGGNPDGSDMVLNFVDDGHGNYSYTFPPETTIKGPVTVNVVTGVSDGAYDPDHGTDSVAMTTKISSTEEGKVGSNDNANSSAEVAKATVSKMGEQVNGNTIRWTMVLNKNKANVYEATITDPLAAGLSVDTTAGITVKNTVTGASYKLTGTSDSKTDGSASIGYTLTTDADGKQEVKLVFGTFGDSYEIKFDTKISATMANDDKVSNTAYISVRYPKGDSGTEPVSWGEPALDVNYTTAYLKVASTKADPVTGTLGWEIHPSTKSDSYDTAVITNTIPDDQAYIDGTIGIKVGNNIYKQGDAEFDQYVTAASVNGQDISVTFNRTKLKDAGAELGDVSVVYDTKALNYFKSDEPFTYNLGTGKGAKLKVDEFAVEKNTNAKLQNNMLKSKVESKYDDTNNEGSLDLTLTLDQNKMNLTNVQVVDDFSDAVYYKDDKIPETKLEAGDYEVIVDEGTVTDHKWTVDLSSINNKTQLKAKIKLTEAGKKKLKLGEDYTGATIYLKNHAELTADELLGTFSSDVTGSGAEQVLQNQQAVKSGIQTNEKITWYVDLNNMGASLGSTATVTDAIGAGMTLDKKSIKLYEGLHGTSGTAITSAAATEIDPSTYDVKVQKTKAGKVTMIVTLPSGTNESYRLVYDTYLDKGGVSYDNEATYKVDNKSVTAKATVNAAAFAWGSGSPMAKVNITLKDKIDESTPVEGAEYALFSQETYDAVGGDTSKLTEDNADDYNWTDAKGKVSFITKPGQYYIKAMDDPEGGIYTVDTDAHEVELKRGNNKYDQLADRTTGKDGVDTVLTLTNTFMNGRDGNTSAFKLYLTTDGGKKVGIKLTKDSDGNYVYAGTTEADGPEQDMIATDASKVGATGNQATLQIKGLPWGNYEFRQVKTANGYVVDTKPIEASLVSGKKATAEVTNNQTILYMTADEADIDPEKTYKIAANILDDPDFKEIEVKGSDLINGVLLQGLTKEGVTYQILDEDGNVVASHAKSSVTAEEAKNAKEFVNKTEEPQRGSGSNPSTDPSTDPSTTPGTTPSTDPSTKPSTKPSEDGNKAPSTNTGDTTTPAPQNGSGNVSGNTQSSGQVSSGASAGASQSSGNNSGSTGGVTITGQTQGAVVTNPETGTKVSSVWVHKSPKTGDDLFSELLQVLFCND